MFKKCLNAYSSFLKTDPTDNRCFLSVEPLSLTYRKNWENQAIKSKKNGHYSNRAYIQPC